MPQVIYFLIVFSALWILQFMHYKLSIGEFVSKRLISSLGDGELKLVQRDINQFYHITWIILKTKEYRNYEWSSIGNEKRAFLIEVNFNIVMGCELLLLKEDGSTFKVIK